MNKEKIEKAIETINSLLFDFTEALDGLREIREFLYEIQECGIFIEKTVAEKLIEEVNIQIAENVDDTSVNGKIQEYLYKLQGALLGALGGTGSEN